jgi:hypothetical protein
MRRGTGSACPVAAVVLVAFLLRCVHIESFKLLLALKIQPFARLGYYGLC